MRTRLDVALAALVVAAFPLAARPAAAQYPLAPSPVLPVQPGARGPTLGGYLSVRETLRHDSSDVAINRARLTAIAAPLPYLALEVQGELSSSASAHVGSDSSVHGFELTNAYVQLTLPPGAPGTRFRPALIIGQFKQPFSLEYLTPFAELLTASRSEVVDRYAPKRDVGAMAQVAFGKLVRLDASLTNGEGPNTTANPDGRQLAIGRVTVFPLPWLALAAKLADQGADHARGMDGRLVWRTLTLEGEGIHRSRDLASGAHVDAGGGYLLAGWRALSWLTPVFKHEWYEETAFRPAGPFATRRSASTYGVDVAAHGVPVHLLLDWVARRERPTPLDDSELDAQLIATF